MKIFSLSCRVGRLFRIPIYVRTWEGFLYLATVTVIDCHTKECVGYAMADHLGTELFIAALNMVRPGGSTSAQFAPITE